MRLILKDLKIGLGHETLLKNYHPDALEIYNMTSDLKRVFEELKDGKTRFGIDKFALFFPIKPMLAGRVDKSKLEEIVQGQKFLIETKFDGERIQVHFKEGDIRMFTRNGNNYTYLYGPKLNDPLRQAIKAK